MKHSVSVEIKTTKEIVYWTGETWDKDQTNAQQFDSYDDALMAGHKALRNPASKFLESDDTIIVAPIGG